MGGFLGDEALRVKRHPVLIGIPAGPEPTGLAYGNGDAVGRVALIEDVHFLAIRHAPVGFQALRTTVGDLREDHVEGDRQNGRGHKR